MLTSGRFMVRIKKQSFEVGSIVEIILFLISWCIFGLNYSNPDFPTYEYLYNYGSNGILTSRIEIGYMFLTRIARFFGMNYIQFRMILSLIGLLIIIRCIKEYTNTRVIVYFAYLLYPFLFDAIQIRVFLVSIIMLFSVRYLVTFNRINLIKYLVCVAVAFSMHSSAVVYIILILCYLNNKKRLLIISFVITVAEIVLLNGRIVQLFLNRFAFLGLNFVLGDRYVSFDASFERLMWIYFGIDLITIVVITLFDQETINDSIFLDCESNILDNYSKYRNMLNKMVYVSLILIPIIKIGSSYGRVFRSVLLIIYCAIVKCNFSFKSKTTINSVIKYGYLLSLAFVLFYAHILTGDGNTYDRVFRSMIENNYIYDLLIK